MKSNSCSSTLVCLNVVITEHVLYMSEYCREQSANGVYKKSDVKMNKMIVRFNKTPIIIITIIMLLFCKQMVVLRLDFYKLLASHVKHTFCCVNRQND